MIENGGQNFYYTKNLRIQINPRGQEEREIIFKPVPEIIKWGSKYKIKIQNPNFNTEAKTSRNNPKYWVHLGRLIEESISNAHIPNFSDVDFYPYLEKKPPLHDTFNLVTPYLMLSYRSAQPPGDFTKSLLYRHIFRDMCDGDPKIFDYLLYWIAYMIRFPTDLVGVAIIFVSAQGTGKDMLGTFIKHLIGDKYTLKFSGMKTFFKDFNLDQVGKIFIRLNEISARGSAFENHDKFKDMIDKKTSRVEPKGIDAYNVRHCGHYMGFSNNENCVYVENSERRFCMIRSNDKHADDRPYFKPIWDEVENMDFCKSAFDYFAYKLQIPPNFKQMKAPMTDFKRQQKIDQLCSSLGFILNGSHVNEMCLDDGKIQATNLYSCFIKYCQATGSKETSEKIFIGWLKRLGWQKKRMRIFGASVYGYIYDRSNLQELFRKFLRDPKFNMPHVDST